MSIAVALDRLGEEMARFGPSAFVLTTGNDGRAHISHVAVTHDEGELRCTVGRRSAENAGTRPQIAVLWAPYETDGFSLIVDADAIVDGSELRLTPTKAILHRPAPQ